METPETTPELAQAGPDPLDSGFWLYEQRRYELALEHALEAAQADPEDPWPLLLATSCHLALACQDEAEAAAREALRRDPDLAEAHHALATVLEAQGRYREAAEANAESLALDPELVRAHHLASVLAIQLDSAEAALAAADRGLALAPRDEECLDSRARALCLLGRLDEARETLAFALSIHPEEPFFHARAGWIALEGGLVPEALGYFTEALRLDPMEPYARNGMAAALKARYRLYRWVYRARALERRLPGWAYLLFVVGVLGGISLVIKTLPDTLAGTIILGGMGVFAVGFALNAMADPVFNMLLCLNPHGRLLLAEHERQGALVLAAMLSFVVVSAPIVWLFGSKPHFLPLGPRTIAHALALCLGYVAVIDLMLIGPVATAFMRPLPLARYAQLAYVGVLATFPFIGPLLMSLGWVNLGAGLMATFITGLVALLWIPTIITRFIDLLLRTLGLLRRSLDLVGR